MPEEVPMHFPESGSSFMPVEEPEDPTLDLHSHRDYCVWWGRMKSEGMERDLYCILSEF